MQAKGPLPDGVSMPISGLVVSFADDPPLRQKAIEAMEAEPRIDVGVIESNRVAIVLDTASGEEDKRLWEWLSALPGVVFIDVAMVVFDEDAQSEASDLRDQPSRCEEKTQYGF